MQRILLKMMTKNCINIVEISTVSKKKKNYARSLAEAFYWFVTDDRRIILLMNKARSRQDLPMISHACVLFKNIVS